MNIKNKVRSAKCGVLGALVAVGLSAFAADPSVTVGEVTAGEPWSTITVNYTLGGVDAATDYKVAFDITAGGQTASVTNDAAKLTDGAATKEINTVEIFGKEVVDTKAKVKVSLIAIKPKVLPAGALKGVFSVSADKKVHFSKGNLVATINDSGAPTAWKFATNQYDCLGVGGANKKIGTAAGDVDLFGWSTASTTYGISKSQTPGDYSGGFVDWGKNIGDGNTWRTLSKDEWTYLFNTRTVNSGKGAGKSYSLNITYGGKMGVVLYPDDYTGSVLSGTVDSLPEGVVFLPAAGFRNGSNVLYVGTNGSYWSSTAVNSNNVYDADFNSGSVDPATDGLRYLGFNVRLVTEVK